VLARDTNDVFFFFAHKKRKSKRRFFIIEYEFSDLISTCPKRSESTGGAILNALLASQNTVNAPEIGAHEKKRERDEKV
jgi:hypothetical protein